MNTSTWTIVVGGVAGLFLAAFGGQMLITGRAPAVTARSFRSVRDAGLYHLLFGMALVLVATGTALAGFYAVLTSVPAVAMAGTAVVRFRPRARREMKR